jgi:phosphopantothenoylcysteine decarboxylase
MLNIILGVTGGIAAYKVADLAGALVKEDFTVKIIMTESAKKFITPLTLATLSKNPVYDDVAEWTADGPIKHIELAKWCDLFVVVPATANTIAKMAHGMADNLLTSTYLALPPNKGVLICPAMNTRMWEAEQTKDNLALLKTNKDIDNDGKSSNFSILQPEEGMLACGDVGMGKLPSVRTIVGTIKSFLEKL